MITRIGTGSRPSLTALLATDPVQNLFLLGFVHATPLDRALWLGAYDGDLTGAALIIPDRLAVPFAPDAAHAEAIGGYLRGRYAPTMIVGPRAASDALWRGWTQGHQVPARCYDQRLYTCRAARQSAPDMAVRQAKKREWRTVSEYAARMQVEDLGQDPRAGDPALHDRVVKDRIRRGVTWVMTEGADVVFQVNVGTDFDGACQVGGTYVPPAFRGRGLASAGMASLANTLLATHHLVTLHVNEANTPAVRAYERAGFTRDAPYRLLTVD